jgi:hypothetical protein
LIRIFFSFFIVSQILALPLKKQDYIDFIEARYSGDTSTVDSMITENFMYNHVPYVGLGIFTEYVESELVVTGIVDDSIQTALDIGDRIHEINGTNANTFGQDFNGPVGDMQTLILTKSGDSTFQDLTIPLAEYQYRQNNVSFYESILNYATIWYSYEIKYIDILKEKEKAIVYYVWKGSKDEGGSVYQFYAMEAFYSDKKSELIYQVDALWSEKQFRDQFK